MSSLSLYQDRLVSGTTMGLSVVGRYYPITQHLTASPEVPLPHHAAGRLYGFPLPRYGDARKMASSETRNDIYVIPMTRRRTRNPVPLTGSASGRRTVPGTSDIPPDHLAFAGYAGRSSISLRFSDGYAATVSLAQVGVKTVGLRLNTARASSWGSAVEVEDKRGRTIHIDSAVLRAHCDPKYAAELRQAIASLTAQ